MDQMKQNNTAWGRYSVRTLQTVLKIKGNMILRSQVYLLNVSKVILPELGYLTYYLNVN